MPAYYLYILKCVDTSLYTGITTDLKRRLSEHNLGNKGAKYTAARRPLELVYQKKYRNRSLALVAEAGVKKLTRAEKLILLKK